MRRQGGDVSDAVLDWAWDNGGIPLTDNLDPFIDMADFNIDYDDKRKRLVIKAPFVYADVCRSFPSRRFDPKTKTWRAPLVKANIAHLQSIRLPIKLTEAARDALTAFHATVQGPVYKPFPRDFRFKLPPMEHQWKMLDLSWNLKASAWFAEMGTGKTFSAISLMCALFEAGEIDAVNVVAPSTLRRTWMKELKKYATVPYDFRIHETKASWLTDFYAGKFIPRGTLPILATSVEGLGVSPQLYDSVCGFYPGRRVLTVVDESSRIKNPDALRTERTITFGGVSARTLILNGTPIALGLQDLWAQYEFLDPNIIGTGDYWAYKTRYIQMGGYENKQIVGYQNVDELMNCIRPYTVEIRKKDVLTFLPPKVPKTLYFQATPEQKAHFKQVIKGVGGPNAIKVTNTLEKMLRLRQIVGGYNPVFHQDPFNPDNDRTELVPLAKNPKMDGLFEFIDDHKLGSKFIIWSSFRHEIEYIRDRLRERYGDASTETYYGDTAMEDRSAIEDRYCRDPKMRFFVGNPTAAGLGLTLISGENDVMVYYSGTAAFIDRAQSEDRAHRIGQKNSVVVVDMVMEKTVDVAIQEAIAQKLDLDQFVKDQLAKGVSEIEIYGGGAD